MQAAQYTGTSIDDLVARLDAAPRAADLVLVFATRAMLEDPRLAAALTAHFDAPVVGCSSAGEISCQGAEVDSVVVTAVSFAATRVEVARAQVATLADSWAAGAEIARQLPHAELATVLVFGPGVDINGSALIAGLSDGLPAAVSISGGLAGDDGGFDRTSTLAGGEVGPRQVVAVGLYGDRILARHGSNHGWRPFGPLRRVTRCQGNLLYELDVRPALDIYREYLGDYARDLPTTGLLFPFEMVSADGGQVGLIRTILGIDADAGMLILAGDIAPDGFLRLMHSTTNALVDGAEAAATAVAGQPADDALALLVSCVGRRLVMGPRTDDEIEAVRAILGARTTIAGFYSYGEIAPHLTASDCALHNQTMTVTYLIEKAVAGTL
ncbi:MAG: FIST N-terminal domain-containing protein [Kofleriaceae bacterium]